MELNSPMEIISRDTNKLKEDRRRMGSPCLVKKPRTTTLPLLSSNKQNKRPCKSCLRCCKETFKQVKGCLILLFRQQQLCSSLYKDLSLTL